MSINSVVLVGNLTRDPDLRSTATGTSVLNFGIAVNDRERVAGEWKDVPSFFDVTVFGRRAEALANILTKGLKVAVVGRLKWSQWQDTGIKKTRVYVIADDVELMAKRQQEPELYTEDLPF